MQRRRLKSARLHWRLLLPAIVTTLLVAGCGRVDLEDLTPEAFRTQQAANPKPTLPPSNTGSGGTPVTGTGTQASSGSGGGRPADAADLAAGKSQYDTWCAACHDSGRATALKGRQIAFADIENMLRTGTGGAAPHPSYKVTELTNSQFEDILAYIASASP